MRYVPTNEKQTAETRAYDKRWAQSHPDTRNVSDPANKVGHYQPSNAPSAH